MNILELVDTYVDALVALQISNNPENMQMLQADVNNKCNIMRLEFEKSDSRSLRTCIDALNEAIEAKRLEIDALSSRYMLGVTQKNIAIINNDLGLEKDYDEMIQDTLFHCKEAEIVSNAYKEVLKEITRVLGKGRN